MTNDRGTIRRKGEEKRGKEEWGRSREPQQAG